jgi:iron-sulfur cluster assembly accessory protein
MTDSQSQPEAAPITQSQPETPPADVKPEAPSPITLTERAAAEVRRVMEEQGFSTDEYILETGVVGGGCSGFSYKLGFKEKSLLDPAKETVVTTQGIDVAVNNRSMLYIAGTIIDYHEGMTKRGFAFSNPSVKTTCGCGSSFSV